MMGTNATVAYLSREYGGGLSDDDDNRLANQNLQPPELTVEEAMEIAFTQSELTSSPSGTTLLFSCRVSLWRRAGW
jgi:hypothetical protein